MSERCPVVVLGAGKIGRLVGFLLADCGDYDVTIADLSAEQSRRAASNPDGSPIPNLGWSQADFGNADDLRRVLGGAKYVLSCAPYWCNPDIAAVAREQGLHYLDLTEDVQTTKAVMGLAEGAETAFIPQSGLAPGFITIVAKHLTEGFDRLDSVKMRVGALPMHPHNRLKYNLTWSTDGLINEYGNPCEAIVGGERTWVQPLQGHETLTIDGDEYEAFNTSGGLGTLADTLYGKVRQLNYKTIRYPGHREIIALLMLDFRLNEDRDTLKKIFERSLPHTKQDVVVVFVTVTGWKDGIHSQRSYARKSYHGEIGGRHWGAIQITTAAGICAVMDLHHEGLLPASGFVRQEDVPYEAFIANRFGRHYAEG